MIKIFYIFTGSMSLVMGLVHADGLDVQTLFKPLGQDSYRLDWIGKDGITCFPQFSTNLTDWFYLPEVDQGVIHDPIDVSPRDGLGMPYPSFFMRMVLSDYPALDPKGADYDGDGVSNWDELNVTHTDPLKADSNGDGIFDGQHDTDGDGLADEWEQMLIGRNAALASTTLADITPAGDADGDGVSNLREYQLGLSGYQTDTDGDGYSDRLSVDQSLFLKFDETADSLAVDSSAEKCNGTSAGASWQPTSGVSKGALQFHGGADAVKLPGKLLANLENLTISLWFKTSNVTNQTLIGSEGMTQLALLEIGIEGGNVIRLNAPTGTSAIWAYPRSLADGLWHHLIVIRNAGAGMASIWLDGSVFGSTKSISSSPLAVAAVALGQRFQTLSAYDSTKPFVGLLDDVRIWSVVMDPIYLAELFHPNDLDQDGLPDDYERARTGDLITLAGGNHDADGDGVADRLEIQAGTSPIDYYNGIIPVITLESGGGQTIYNGERTRNPLVFKITAGVNLLVNAPVDLTHPGLVGVLGNLAGDKLDDSLNLRTDTAGKVSIYFKAD
jgi:hypothetical protein